MEKNWKTGDKRTHNFICIDCNVLEANNFFFFNQTSFYNIVVSHCNGMSGSEAGHNQL